ncbi:MAG: glycosyltransferase [Actinomycetaceae bacterium]|nr:glycosyltransferase [Actinomycetaceae bacterium]
MIRKRACDILFVTRIHLPEVAAATFRIAAVENEVAKLGYQIRALTTKVIGDNQQDESLVRLPVLRDSEGYVKGIIQYLSFDIPALFYLLVASRPQIMVIEPPPTTGTIARIAGTIRRVPYVWYAADVWSDATASMGASRIVVRAVRAMEKFALKGAAGVIAVSDGVAERVNALGSRRTVIIPNGADTTIFNPRVKPFTRSELARVGVVHPYFIYAGTASQWQGAELFADAFVDYWEPDCDRQFVIVGRGDTFDYLNSVADDLAARAHSAGVDYRPLIVLGQTDSVSAARWQRGALAATVSIRPGQGYDFAYPTKVLTALACGTPVLYAGVGPATDDIITYDLGVSVPYNRHAVRSAFGQSWGEYSRDDHVERLFTWVEKNRSMQATGQAAAKFIASCIPHR